MRMSSVHLHVGRAGCRWPSVASPGFDATGARTEAKGVDWLKNEGAYPLSGRIGGYR